MSARKMSEEELATSLIRRFWDRVIRSEGCWSWTGQTDIGGYGVLASQRRTIRAHRLSYEIANGPIPDGMCALHRCDNPPCSNPEHIFLGTRIDNNIDKIKKGRGWSLRGEAASRLGLTDDQVLDIWRSTEPLGAVARRFGVSAAHVAGIRAGRTWAHVTGGSPFVRRQRKLDGDELSGYVERFLAGESCLSIASGSPWSSSTIKDRVAARLGVSSLRDFLRRNRLMAADALWRDGEPVEPVTQGGK